jgi:hypothetical protein
VLAWNTFRAKRVRRRVSSRQWSEIAKLFRATTPGNTGAPGRGRDFLTNRHNLLGASSESIFPIFAIYPRQFSLPIFANRHTVTTVINGIKEMRNGEFE